MSVTGFLVRRVMVPLWVKVAGTLLLVANAIVAIFRASAPFAAAAIIGAVLFTVMASAGVLAWSRERAAMGETPVQQSIRRLNRHPNNVFTMIGEWFREDLVPVWVMLPVGLVAVSAAVDLAGVLPL